MKQGSLQRSMHSGIRGAVVDVYRRKQAGCIFVRNVRDWNVRRAGASHCGLCFEGYESEVRISSCYIKCAVEVFHSRNGRCDGLRKLLRHLEVCSLISGFAIYWKLSGCDI